MVDRLLWPNGWHAQMAYSSASGTKSVPAERDTFQSPMYQANASMMQAT